MAFLQVRPGGVYVDCTLGGGGHSELILRQGGTLIALDRDKDALAAAGERLAPYADRFIPVHSDFRHLAQVLGQYAPTGIDGFLMDLGVSSFQLDTACRGFSYQHDAPLDMRMDRTQTLTAHEVVNTYPKRELEQILFRYGEERFSPRIADAIVRTREQRPIETTVELAELIKSAIPAAARKDGPHPAKRSFQALRIAVNDELNAIAPAIDAGVEALRPGGRAAVITFHSLEDRIVKQSFAALAKGCTCPPDFPMCVCGKTPKVKLVNKKPLEPSAQEVEVNPRARSAKCRAAEKL